MQTELTIQYVDPAELAPADYNPRTIDPKALRRLASLLDAHGFVDPVIARAEDKLLIGGHQRLKANALRQRPDALVPVVFLPGVSDERAKALNVALNNQQAAGEYEMDKLGALLSEIDTGTFDVAAFTGFSEDDLAAMTVELDAEAPEPEIRESYQVAVECGDEDVQRELYERLTSEGFTCRLLML